MTISNFKGIKYFDDIRLIVITLTSEQESIPKAEKIIEIMENAVQLEVPNKVDYEKGPSWGEAK